LARSGHCRHSRRTAERQIERIAPGGDCARVIAPPPRKASDLAARADARGTAGRPIRTSADDSIAVSADGRLIVLVGLRDHHRSPQWTR
jgi:hypothetical protein